MGLIRRTIVKASSRLDLPADITAGMPLIEITGTTECSIEPQKGLLEYSQETVLVETSAGTVEISGTKISIKNMNSSRLTVTGNIHSVSFVQEDALE